MNRAEAEVRISQMTDAELMFVARWLAINRPAIAGEAIQGMADYRRDFPADATRFLGPVSEGAR